MYVVEVIWFCQGSESIKGTAACLFYGGEEVLVAQREGLFLAQVDCLGIKVDQLRLRHPCRCRARLCNTIEGHKSLARDVVYLACSCIIAKALAERGCQVLHVAQLRDLGTACKFLTLCRIHEF